MYFKKTILEKIIFFQDILLVHGTRRTRERQGIRAYARSEVGFRRRLNRQYGKQDRAYMRLDRKRSGLAFGSPASRRCAAGTRRTSNK